jgi:hypothetical protein
MPEKLCFAYSIATALLTPQRKSVGWVKQSATHRPNPSDRSDPPDPSDPFTSFPSCTLVITHKPDAIVHSTQMDPNLNSSPKGFNISAQGNALGTRRPRARSPERAKQDLAIPVLRPFRAKQIDITLFPGRCPMGAKITDVSAQRFNVIINVHAHFP